MKHHPVYIIAAVDDKFGIGKKGKLPWDLKRDIAHFQRITTRTENPARQNMVLMGQNTWESLPAAHRPLAGRRNIVLSHDKNYKAPGAYVFDNMKDALESADEDLVESVFIMGGGQVYAASVKLRNLKGIYLTHVKSNFDCDTFFPKVVKSMRSESLGKETENGIEFEFKFYKK